MTTPRNTSRVPDPAGFSSTLSIVSAANGPYDDVESDDGLLHYAYRKGDPFTGDNRKLRAAIVRGPRPRASIVRYARVGRAISRIRSRTSCLTVERLTRSRMCLRNRSICIAEALAPRAEAISSSYVQYS